MQYKMFLANGQPTRATVAVPGWLLECTFVPAQASPSATHRVVHELSHVVQGGAVRGWHLSKNRWTPGLQPAQNTFRTAPVRPAEFMPEVDDEVLVSFQSSTPRSTAISFNPEQLSRTKDLSGSHQTMGGPGDVGMVHAGNYRVVVKQRSGFQPLTLALVVAHDPALQIGVEVVRIF